MRRSFALAAVAAFGAIGLAGCNDLGGSLAPPTARVSAPGVPISVESIGGAPAGVSGQFATQLSQEAQARQMQIVGGTTPARFRVRGYLTAEPTEDGKTALAFVWDVFDKGNSRAQRVQGATVSSARAGSDPWAAVDAATVNRAASDSMDAIATFLAAVPASPITTTAASRRGSNVRAQGASSQSNE
ncbi:MAG: hypothetical protein ACRC56_09085 [Bosea sp. (in: a-proteobacteria)]